MQLALAAYVRQPDGTVRAVSAREDAHTRPKLRGGAPKKCDTSGCLERAMNKLVGECRYCEGVFCGKHRLPEGHSCRNLQTCRQGSFDKNQDKLLNGKCVSDRLKQ